jgi:hypothetical protein
MRKSLVGFVFLALCLAFSGLTAHAQTAISLNGGTCNNCFTFAVGGGFTTMTETSTVSGPGGSIGPLTPSQIPASLTYTFSEVSPIKFTYAGGGLYTFSSGGPFHITLAGTGFSLIGTLSVQDLQQISIHGLINTMIVGNFSITSSTCAVLTACATGKLGYGSVDLLLSSAIPPITNGSKGSFNGGIILLPAVNPSVTPEPTSLLLFGTGLLVLGGALRRRLSGSAA